MKYRHTQTQTEHVILVLTYICCKVARTIFYARIGWDPDLQKTICLSSGRTTRSNIEAWPHHSANRATHSGQTPEAVTLRSEVISQMLHQLVEYQGPELVVVEAMDIVQLTSGRAILVESESYVLLERFCRAGLEIFKAHAVEQISFPGSAIRSHEFLEQETEELGHLAVVSANLCQPGTGHVPQQDL